MSKGIRRKANWIGYILKRNCLLKDVTGGCPQEIKKKKNQLLADLKGEDITILEKR